ncbi:glycosyltransferase family 4 protein [Aquihabitans sp. G128]|uniref:glycosyltransferase family 4 protein n=1 Tax=Aquihabitans sp. G128 TaxID=2849779 RepID=UPI001C21004B|nr:glycosyltransferase family 4 protein [Aquihabitans sp. G128]QXC61434.1 glycosyltransferase family 4 protein [Aquihabitans sp. G128]
MNLLVLCPHFAPDLAPTGEVMTQIAEQLVARGHRLHVVTSLPWYQHHAIEPGWGGRAVRHDDTEWGRITRVHPFPTDKRNIPARALGFAGFTALTGLAGLVSRSRPDVVLAMSPPLTLGAAGWAAARAHRVPFVFNIQDVFPDVAVELGALTNPKVIAAASFVERETYLRADAVTVLSEDLKDNVAAKIAGRRGTAGHADKVRVIPNFIDTDWIRPGERENAYRREHGLEGKTVVMYAGNVGLSQSLDLVLAAATHLAHDPQVVFVVNGGGSALAGLQQAAAGMDNVRFVGMQPKARLPEVAAAADLHVVPLRTGLARSSVPSKLYTILAAGRPVVASVDRGTEVARTVEQAGAGLAVPPDDAEAFTKAIERLVQAPAEATAMGAAGRRFVERWASPAAVAEAYDALFEELRSGR